MDNQNPQMDAAVGMPGTMTGNDGAAPLICLRNINKSYHNNGVNIDVLNDLSFDISAGDTIAVVGESGIGKSTLLHILGALDRPDNGSLLYQGKDVFEFDGATLAKFRNRSLGFVFQFHYLLAEFSAMENVMMPGLINGLNRKQIQTSAESILIRVACPRPGAQTMHTVSRRAHRQSGSEKQPSDS
jgi:lipoprotein-releasing system ATP-binding protein